MKVLVQDWETSRGLERTSISRDQASLEEEKRDIANDDSETLKPIGEPKERRTHLANRTLIKLSVHNETATSIRSNQ